MRAIFITRASPRIGGGHVMRCLTLADALAARGWSCAFAADEATLAVPALARSGHARAPAGPAACDLAVFDDYGLDAVAERSWRGAARTLMAIDDLADRPHAVDLLLDQGAGREATDYAGLVAPGTRVLAGPRYALLRPEFAAARAPAPAESVRRLLLSFGLADPGGATAGALDGLAAIGFAGEVTVVLGALAPTVPAVRAALGRLSGRLVLDAGDMAALLAETDLALGAGGVSALERCCVGVPSLMAILAENQRPGATAMAAAGAAALLADLSPDALAEGLARLAPVAARRDMREAARALCDGQGVARVIAAMEERA